MSAVTPKSDAFTLSGALPVEWALRPSHRFPSAVTHFRPLEVGLSRGEALHVRADQTARYRRGAVRSARSLAGAA